MLPYISPCGSSTTTRAKYFGEEAGKNPIKEDTYLSLAMLPFSYFCAVPVFPFTCVNLAIKTLKIPYK